MTVTALGRVQGARVVADGGDARLASRGLRAAESGHYRPRLVDGVPVDTPGVRFVQPFFVLRAIPPGESPPAEAAEATGLDPTKPDEAARDAAPPETRAPGTDPPQGGG
jgi:hypothetical protein